MHISGALKLLYGQKAFDAAESRGAWSDIDAEPTRVINRDELLKMEPWLVNLKAQKEPLSGAVFQTEASSGDCEAVTVALADVCRENGKLDVRFEGSVHITGSCLPTSTHNEKHMLFLHICHTLISQRYLLF
jgi:glycine/D-amino acid oxidase-like deaminating enzyme